MSESREKVEREAIESAMSNVVHVPLAYYNELVIKSALYDHWMKAQAKADKEFSEVLNQRLEEDKPFNGKVTVAQIKQWIEESMDSVFNRVKERTDDKETKTESPDK